MVGFFLKERTVVWLTAYIQSLQFHSSWNPGIMTSLQNVMSFFDITFTYKHLNFQGFLIARKPKLSLHSLLSPSWVPPPVTGLFLNPPVLAASMDASLI